MAETPFRGRARWAVDHAQDVPAEAARVAAEVLAASLDPETRVLAGWAAGLAARELGELAAAERSLREAVRGARSGGLPGLAAEIGSSLSLVFAYRGDTAAALREANRAAKLLDGHTGARNEAQRALILQRLGRYDEALAGYDRALAGLRAAGDEIGTVRLLLNRGVLHGYRFRFAEGIADLREAAATATTLGQALLLASVSHNLGFLEGRRGDFPAALERLEEAATLYERAGAPPGHLAMLASDRIDVLRAAGLVDSAHRAADGLVDAANANAFDRAEVLLVAARCALEAGDMAEAALLAGEAERDFAARRRGPWADVSRLVAVRAEAGVGANPGELSRRTARLGGRLAQAGLLQESAEARLWAGRLAEEAGERARARASYRRVLAAAPTTTMEEALGAEAAARLALLDGDAAAAEASARRGIDAVARGIMALGGTEMRARATDRGLDLTAIAVRTAIDRGDPLAVLSAVDTRRSLTSRLPSVRAATDPGYAGLLGELRDVLSRLETPDETPEERAVLVGRLGRLEAAITERERRRPGLAGGPLMEVAVEELIGRLGSRTAVSYFADRDRLRAVVASPGGVRLADAGPASHVAAEVRSLVFSLGRLAAGRGSPASLGAARLAAEEAARSLDAALLSDVGEEGELVVVPTGVLHRLPWRALPSLARRPFVVSPSLTAWGVAADRPSPPGPPAWLGVAGPGLAAAPGEVRRIAALYPAARALTGGEATTARVREELAVSDAAHIAAHGTFRTDNPLFSSVRMADGPLTIYELELLPAVPRLVVLSACDSGVNEVTRGDALLGLSSALLGLGAGVVVGPVVSVPDEEAAAVMIRFHELLRLSGSPAAALAGVGGDGGHQQWATERVFVVFGAG